LVSYIGWSASGSSAAVLQLEIAFAGIGPAVAPAHRHVDKGTDQWAVIVIVTTSITSEQGKRIIYSFPTYMKYRMTSFPLYKTSKDIFIQVNDLNSNHKIKMNYIFRRELYTPQIDSSLPSRSIRYRRFFHRYRIQERCNRGREGHHTPASLLNLK